MDATINKYACLVTSFLTNQCIQAKVYLKSANANAIDWSRSAALFHFLAVHISAYTKQQLNLMCSQIKNNKKKNQITD